MTNTYVGSCVYSAGYSSREITVVKRRLCDWMNRKAQLIFSQRQNQAGAPLIQHYMCLKLKKGKYVS